MEGSAFIKQLFVVMGMSLNLAQFGLAIGYSALLLPQLRKPDSEIPIDDVTGSWIASLPTLSLLIGNVTIPVLMSKAGRKPANLISITIVFIGWICIVFSTNVSILLTARFLQGISLGMCISSSPISIAEYTSPKWRGAFLTLQSLILSLGTLFVHTITSFITWKSAAVVCTVITFIDFLIVVFSPESPSWLATQGRYDDCQRVFRWLRCNEEDELSKLIEASKSIRKNNAEEKKSVQKLKTYITSFINVLKKKEFYKPIFIAAHIYFIAIVCGINLLSAYTVDIINEVTRNTDVNMPLAVISLDVQRFITNLITVYLIRTFKRRTVLFWSGFWNILAYLMISMYVALKSESILPFDSPVVGIFLIHFHIFSATIGTLPISFIICGELFSLKYRSISSGISSVLLSICFFSVIKTFPSLTARIGLSGSFALYGSLLFYCILVAYFYLPETKDKTLQEIEEEFKDRKSMVDEQSVHSLMLPEQSR